MSLLAVTFGSPLPVPEGQEGVALDHLTTQAEFAIRAGVRLTWEDWVSLETIERQAFTAAGDRVEVSRARKVALASQSPLGYAAASIDIDGGAEHDDLLVQAAADAVAQKVTHGRLR